MEKKANQKQTLYLHLYSGFITFSPFAYCISRSEIHQPQIPLTLILMALFYGGGSNRLRREKFFYHFSFDYSKLTNFLGQSLLAVIIIFVFSVLIGFVELSNFQTKDLVPKIFFKNINVWFYYVGLAEEIIFKVLLLRLLADSFTYHHLKNPETLSLVVSAVIFGLAHAVKGLDYAFLAFLSSCVTGTFYLRYRGILSPIFFHMMLDVVAVSLFQVFFYKKIYTYRLVSLYSYLIFVKNLV